MPKFITKLAGTAFILSACKHAGSIPAPERPTPTTTDFNIPETITNSVGPWVFHPSVLQNRRYRSTTVTTTYRDQLPKEPIEVDTTTFTTDFTISIDPTRSPILISGYTNSIFTIPPPHEMELLPISPIAFSGKIVSNEISIKSAEMDLKCYPQVNMALAEIQSTIVLRPLTLSPASVWTDSVSTAVCSTQGMGGNSKSLRSYRVLGEVSISGNSVMAVERTNSTTFLGTGNYEHHDVQISSTGVGYSQLYLDLTTGFLHSMKNTQKTEIIIKAGGRLQRFHQQVTQQVDQQF